MRGSTIKKIKKFAEASWNLTSKEELENSGFKDKNHYIDKLVLEWKNNPKFRKFVDWNLKNVYD